MRNFRTCRGSWFDSESSQVISMSREDVQSLHSFTSQSWIRPTETCTVQRERPTDPRDQVQKDREKCTQIHPAAQRRGRRSPLLFWKISGRIWNSERAADYYKTSTNTLIICFNTTKRVKAAEELKVILLSP